MLWFHRCNLHADQSDPTGLYVSPRYYKAKSFQTIIATEFSWSQDSTNPVGSITTLFDMGTAVRL